MQQKAKGTRRRHSDHRIAPDHARAFAKNPLSSTQSCVPETMIDTERISNSGEKSLHEYNPNIISTTVLNVNFNSTSNQVELSLKKSSKWNQIFATVAATLSAAGLGCVFAYTATALPDMRERKPFGTITSSQETWIGPVALLGGTLACPFAGLMLDGYGRQRTIAMMMPVFVGGWIVIACAQNMEMIYVGRFITGFCGGSINLAIPVFLGEMSEVSIRGALTSCLDLMVTVGILVAYLLGTFVDWRIQAAGCGLMPLLSFALILFVPESPRYLLLQGKVKASRESLAWFRKLGEDQIQQEFFQLSSSVAKKTKGNWEHVWTFPILKPIAIGVALMVVQQCSGILPIIAYAVDIFHSAGTDMDDNLCTNIVGVIQVVATCTSALLVDKFGRRVLLMVTQVFMVGSMSGMGTFFYLKNETESYTGQLLLDHLSWLPLTCLMAFVIAFSLGIGPISWVYMGEILPCQVKGVGSALITGTSWLLSFGMTLGFKGLMDTVGEAGGYWIFGGTALLGLIFIYYCVPETKGKSLEEIQALFN